MRSVHTYALCRSLGGTFMERERYGTLELYKPPATGEYKDVKNARCEVVAPPPHIDAEAFPLLLRKGLWDAAREPRLREGDTVYVHYIALEPDDPARLASGHAPRWVRTPDGEALARVAYPHLLAVERAGTLIPLGGTILAEEVQAVVDYGRSGIIAKEKAKGPWFGRVVAINPALTCTPPLTEGTLIAVVRGTAMEANFHGIGEQRRRLSVVGIEDVMAIIENPAFDDEGNLVINNP